MKQPQKKEAGTTTPSPAATAVMCLNLLPKFLGFKSLKHLNGNLLCGTMWFGSQNMDSPFI